MADWKKRIGWVAVGIGALLLVLVVGGILVLRTGAFQRYAISKLIAQAQEATGANVEVKGLGFDLKHLTVHLYGLTLHGTEGARQPPLLQVEKATVEFSILSVLHHKINLSEVIVERPVLALFVDKQGRTNVPVPPPTNQKSSSDIFDLAIGHVLLRSGEIYLRDRKIPVDANLFGLRTEIHFSQLQKKYSGTIGYDSGTLHYEQLRPLPHAMQASFYATPSELNLNPLVLTVGGSRALLNASVRDYKNTPVVNGQYHLSIHSQDFAGLSSARTAGDVILTGVLSYRDVANQSAIKTAKVNGTVDSNGLAISTDQAAVKIQKLKGQYQLADGTFRAQGFALNLLNGTLKADGTIQHLDATPQSRFHLAVSGVSLEQLRASLRGYSQQPVIVRGAVDAQTDAAWTGSVANVKASSSVSMHGTVISPHSPQSEQFPLNANVKINYDGVRKIISIPMGTAQLPATTVTAQGEVGDRSNLIVRASSSNLHQLMLLASGFSSGQSGTSTFSTMQGAAQLNAVVQGTLQNPRISAQLVATRLQVRQGQFSSLRMNINASPAGIAIQNGTLVTLPRGQLQFSAGVGLRRWAYSSASPLSASLTIQQVPLAMLDQLVMASYPVTGDLNGKLDLHGSQMDPKGQGKLQVTKGKIQEEPVQNLTLQFTASGGTVRSQLDLGSTKASLNFTPRTKAYETKVEVPPLDISKLHAIQARNLPVKGTFSLTASGAGTIDDPRLAASVRVQQFQLRQTGASDVQADLQIANHLAKLAVNSSGGPANLRGNATVHLTPGYYTEASLDTGAFPLDPLLALYLPSRPPGLRAETELHASMRGPAADKSSIEAHLTVPVFKAQLDALQLSNASPIRVDYAQSTVTLRPVTFSGTGTALQFQGRVPLNRAVRMNVAAKGTIDLRLLRMLSPDTQSGGTIALDINAGGTMQNPGMRGQVRLQNVSLATMTAPLGIDSLNALMQVSDQGLEITNAGGKMGGGDIRFGGSLVYRPELQLNLSLAARSVRLRYPDGMRAVFDSDLILSGNSEDSTLQGRVLIDSLSFTSDFDLGTFMAQFTGTSAPSTGAGFADRLKLQVAVQSSSQLNAGTAQLGIEGQANLRLIGTAASPVVVGRADLTSGDLFYKGRQYHLERGMISFVNPTETAPVMNMVITTTIKQYNLNISIRGPIEKLQTSYVSDPPLPPVDIISLITRGETTQEGAPESFGANAVLAKGISGAESIVGSNISKLTGISGLQIDPMIGGNNTNPSARIGLQNRVTKNFLFTFSTDVTQPQNEIVQGEYQLNKRWSVSVVRNATGGFAVDGRFHTNF